MEDKLSDDEMKALCLRRLRYNKATFKPLSLGRVTQLAIAPRSKIPSDMTFEEIKSLITEVYQARSAGLLLEQLSKVST